MLSTIIAVALTLSPVQMDNTTANTANTSSLKVQQVSTKGKIRIDYKKQVVSTRGKIRI